MWTRSLQIVTGLNSMSSVTRPQKFTSTLLSTHLCPDTVLMKTCQRISILPTLSYYNCRDLQRLSKKKKITDELPVVAQKI